MFDESEDLYDFSISILFEQFLCENQDELYKLAVIKLYLFGWLTLICSIKSLLKVSIHSFEVTDSEFVYVDFKEIQDERLSTFSATPFYTKRLNINRMHKDFPTLKDIYKFDFSKFLISKWNIDIFR